MSVVVMAILTGSVLWGGCAACEQLYTRPSSKSGCCLPAGQCQKPGPTLPIHKHCAASDVALQQYVKANAVAQTRAQTVVARVEATSPLAAPLVERRTAAPLDLAATDPPELFLLHSVLLI